MIELRSYNGGTEVEVYSDPIDINNSPEIIGFLNKGLGQLIAENSLEEPLSMNLEVMSRYKDGFNGPIVIFQPARDINQDGEYFVNIRHLTKAIKMHYKPEEGVTEVISHNFDTGYMNSIRDFLPYTVNSCISIAKKKGSFEWLLRPVD